MKTLLQVLAFDHFRSCGHDDLVFHSHWSGRATLWLRAAGHDDGESPEWNGSRQERSEVGGQPVHQIPRFVGR